MQRRPRRPQQLMHAPRANPPPRASSSSGNPLAQRPHVVRRTRCNPRTRSANSANSWRRRSLWRSSRRSAPHTRSGSSHKHPGRTGAHPSRPASEIAADRYILRSPDSGARCRRPLFHRRRFSSANADPDTLIYTEHMAGATKITTTRQNPPRQRRAGPRTRVRGSDRRQRSVRRRPTLPRTPRRV